MVKPDQFNKGTKQDIDLEIDVILARKIIGIAKNDVAGQIKQIIKCDNDKKVSNLQAEIKAITK